MVRIIDAAESWAISTFLVVLLLLTECYCYFFFFFPSSFRPPSPCQALGSCRVVYGHDYEYSLSNPPLDLDHDGILKCILLVQVRR